MRNFGWKANSVVALVVTSLLLWFFTKPLLYFIVDETRVEFVNNAEVKNGINMVFTSRDDKKGQYTVEDSTIYLQVYSDSVYGEFRKNAWCKFRSTGVRFGPTTWHPNIVDIAGCSDTKEGAQVLNFK